MSIAGATPAVAATTDCPSHVSSVAPTRPDASAGGIRCLDLVSSMDAGTRALYAQRWGLPTVVPRVMASMLQQPIVAARVFRRATDGWDGALLSLLVEHAGTSVPQLPGLRSQASELRRWGILQDSDDSWFLPEDLAVAMRGCAQRERFFAATLLGRISRAAILDLAAELGVRSFGSDTQRICRIADALRRVAPEERHRDAMENCVDMQFVETKELVAVTLVEGSGGTRYRVETSSQTFDVTPRETAMAAGLSFDDDEYEEWFEVSVDTSEQSLDIPSHEHIGAVVTFTSSRHADEAIRAPDFHAVVARRLDAHRIATQRGYGVHEAREILAELGFDIDDDATR